MLAALRLDGTTKAPITVRRVRMDGGQQVKGKWEELKNPEANFFGLRYRDDDALYLISIDDKKIREMASEMGEKIGIELTLLHIWLVNDVIPKATPVEYFSDFEKADQAVGKGEYQLAVFIPAMKKHDVILKAMVEKKPVPEKATCFAQSQKPELSSGASLKGNPANNPARSLTNLLKPS